MNTYSVYFTHSDESVHPFCERVKAGGREISTGLQTECTQQRDAMAICNLIDFGSPLPEQYQVSPLLYLNYPSLFSNWYCL